MSSQSEDIGVRDRDAEEVAAALRVSVGLLVRRLRQVALSSELSWPETSALARLSREGPTTASELARLERISPQSIGATLAGLQDRDLIRRGADPQDGRRVLLSLTPAGSALLRDKRNVQVQELARALANEFTSAELEHLRTVAPLLERLAVTFDASGHHGQAAGKRSSTTIRELSGLKTSPLEG